MSHTPSSACSLIIPTWNGRALLERCLRSVLDAVDVGRHEVIVVDDGSTDGTAAFVRSTFPEVIVEEMGGNRGFGEACNAGVARSVGPVVVLLNNDLVVETGFLPPLLEHFQDERVFAVNPCVYQADGRTPGGGLVRGYFHFGLLRLRWSESAEERGRGGLTLYANGAATAIHRRKFLELGGFDALYSPFYSEDLDLSYRAYQRGWEVRYEPRSVVRHDHSQTITAAFDPAFVARISRRNRMLFVWRNVRAPWLLVQHGTCLVLRTCGGLLSGDVTFLRALTDALRRVQEVGRRRRQDPPGLVPDRDILERTSRWALKKGRGTPRRILVTRLRFIGDVVLTTPVVRALRAQYPEAEIVYLAERGPAEALDGHPDVDEVIPFDRESLSRLPLGRRLREHGRFLAGLRTRRFDVVIDLFSNPRSALLTLATGAPLRVGYDVRGRGIVYNVKIRRSSSLSVVDAYLDAVRTLGLPVMDSQPRLALTEEDVQWADEWLNERGIGHEGAVIGLNPGASWPAKMWGTERFAELGDRLVERHQAVVILVHGPGQRSLVEAVEAGMRHRPVIAGLMPLKRLAALIHRFDVFVTNDCGPMHIAAAVGTPTVGLFGPSRPDIWFPYAEVDGHTALTPRVPSCCGRDVCTAPTPCIATIPVDDVCAAVERALSVRKQVGGVI